MKLLCQDIWAILYFYVLGKAYISYILSWNLWKGTVWIVFRDKTNLVM